MKKQVVLELFQNNIEEKTITELKKILSNSNYKNKMLYEYSELQKLLGKSGAANNTAIEIILDCNKKE